MKDLYNGHIQIWKDACILPTTGHVANAGEGSLTTDSTLIKYVINPALFPRAQVLETKTQENFLIKLLKLRVGNTVSCAVQQNI